MANHSKSGQNFCQENYHSIAGWSGFQMATINVTMHLQIMLNVKPFCVLPIKAFSVNYVF
jgi:hypothetical protein